MHVRAKSSLERGLLLCVAAIIRMERILEKLGLLVCLNFANSCDSTYLSNVIIIDFTLVRVTNFPRMSLCMRYPDV